jgi:hypothetical protein
MMIAMVVGGIEKVGPDYIWWRSRKNLRQLLQPELIPALGARRGRGRILRRRWQINQRGSLY